MRSDRTLGTQRYKTYFERIVWAAYVLMLLGTLGLSLPQLLWAPEWMDEKVSVPLDLVSLPETDPFASGTILFVGDIFLGRSVERYSDQYGLEYPFMGVSSTIRSADIAIGNLESSVPEHHVPTPSMTFRFSVREEFLPTLKEMGFDALSLANNHAFDFGSAGYAHTLDTCARTGVVCAGHPYSVTKEATTSVMVGSTRVGILFLHALVPIDQEEMYTSLESLEDHDMVMVYSHWGTEYQKRHGADEEALAHDLIDRGVDAVIGHHPHVVQDIEIYKDRPIFYSLGNFIFDQYFSPEVQQGIGVLLSITDDAHTYSVIPFSSIGTKSQPQRMSGAERDVFLEGLTIVHGDLTVTSEDATVVFPH